MAVNKVIYDGRTIVDMTDATATSETVLKGRTAWLPDSECGNFRLGA